jgi:hypothetical protein
MNTLKTLTAAAALLAIAGTAQAQPATPLPECSKMQPGETGLCLSQKPGTSVAPTKPNQLAAAVTIATPSTVAADADKLATDAEAKCSTYAEKANVAPTDCVESGKPIAGKVSALAPIDDAERGFFSCVQRQRSPLWAELMASAGDVVVWKIHGIGCGTTEAMHWADALSVTAVRRGPSSAMTKASKPPPAQSSSMVWSRWRCSAGGDATPRRA